MKREFMIDRQGKQFVLYAGLLDEAHAKGLKAIRTQLLQIPTPENANTAIFYAEVEMEGGRTFTGIADATPQNVGRQVAAHFIRMAETRAKARALRDAINVGTAALEELGDVDDVAGDPVPLHGPGWPAPDEEEGPKTARPAPPTPIQAARQGGQPARTQPAAASTTGDAATQAQVRAIYLIARDQHGMSDQEVDERSMKLFGVAPNALNKRQASHMITTLKAPSQGASS